MERQPIKFAASPDDNGGGVEKGKNTGIPSNVSVVEFSRSDSGVFLEGIKSELVEKAKEIILSTEKKLNSKSHWRLNFFPPKSEEEIERQRKLIESELGGYYNQEDVNEMIEAGLSLGGLRTTEEDDKKGRDFLLNKEMERRGMLGPLTEGYIVLDLNGRQITVYRNMYSVKYGGVVNFDGAIDYLTRE